MSLPIDLLSLVITHAWSSPLIPRERIQFMTASRLVSKGWSAVHDIVSSSNVHIPCESFYHHFFRRAANRLDRCKRITFTVCNYRDEREATVPPSLTYMRNADIKKLVSLHTIHLVYYDMMFPDPYVQVFFYALPSYLERLIISYNFSPRVPLSAIDFHLKDFVRYSKTRYAEPLVGTLEVNGADGFITAVWESLFPNPKKLLMDGKEVRLMKATSNFDRQHALLVHFEDCERQKLAARRRQIRTLTGSRSAGMDAESVASVTGKTTYGMHLFNFFSTWFS
ncbi:hypothetical protein F5887DRAFT_933571, partial [Amanita rubescens]